MPPKRRSSGNAVPKPSQSTLTFHGRPSKVTKPSVTPAGKSSSKASTVPDTLLATPSITSISPTATSPDTPPTSERAIVEQAQEDAAKAAARTQASPEEEAARKVSAAQIKAYWRAKEQARKAPRVHQADLSLHERILREWDISGQFGVSCDIFSTVEEALEPEAYALVRLLSCLPSALFQTSYLSCSALTMPRQPCIGIPRTRRWKRAHDLGLRPPIEVLAVLLKEQDDDKSQAQRAHVDELMNSHFTE